MPSDHPGARWIRAALQVNPYAYQGKNQPSTSFPDEDAYNRALADKCLALDIGLIAVTDHWAVDTAAGLIGHATERGMVALPGFEANSSEGVHLLVIFEKGTELSTVNAAIGACGVEPGCPNGTTGNPFTEILEAMSERGALVVPAHVNVANGGMLTTRAGQPLIAMVKDPNLHAIAITPSQPAGTDQESIVKSRKPYDRKHPLAVIHSDDVMHPDQLSAEGASSWFKVSSPCLDSLKLAVRTPETRVALTDPTGAPRTLLREISWTGGFLDGVSLPISSDLTALIGGRGTGKSTVIESLRYALDIAPIGEAAAKDHKALVENVIRSGTIIRVEVDVVSPTPRSYTIERVVPGPPVVRDASGTATKQRPSDVAGLVEVFGQHELADLAGDPERVADMVQRFAGTGGIDPAYQDVLAELAENRAQLEKTEDARATLAEELGDIPRLEEQVRQFKETDVATRLGDLERLERDEAIFNEASQRLTTAALAWSDLGAAQIDATLTADYDGLDESPRKDKLDPVVDTVRNLAARLNALAADASEAITSAEAEIARAKAEWESAVKDVREGHAEVLRKLHADGLEPDKYLTTTKALDGLKAKQPRLKRLDESLQTLEADRTKLLDQLSTHERTQLESLHAAVRSANSATAGMVVVRPIPAQDRRHIVDLVTEHVAGQRTQITAAVNADGFSPRVFAAAVRAGVDELAELGIKGAQATNLINAGEPLLRQLEEVSVGHAVEVRLNIATDGKSELKKMNELSKGQRATALLLLLLGASTAPLVIDQPEDDLDNRFVYDGIVQHLRKLKGVRQVIASTHNANVPVLGDAELIVALEGDGHCGHPAKGGIGSLDDEAIRCMAENLLEGGPAAFNARQHLYGF